jgi:hypothetical protein
MLFLRAYLITTPEILLIFCANFSVPTAFIHADLRVNFLFLGQLVVAGFLIIFGFLRVSVVRFGFRYGVVTLCLRGALLVLSAVAYTGKAP